MGLRVNSAEVKRWEQAKLISTACRPKRRDPPPDDHVHRDDVHPAAWRVTLPLPGLRLVSRSNAREHWAKRHARDKREAAQVRAAWLAAGLSGWPVPLPVRVTLKRCGCKPMDGDNVQAAMKAIRDAVASLIGTDDSDEQIQWRYRDTTGRGVASVTIIIRSRRRTALK